MRVRAGGAADGDGEEVEGEDGAAEGIRDESVAWVVNNWIERGCLSVII